MPSPQPNHTDDRLLRGIGRWALTAFAINLTVGSGILGLPAKIQALVGNYSVLVIIACGLLMALIALCFAEVGSRFDRTGGPQLYASRRWARRSGSPSAGCCGSRASAPAPRSSNLAVDYGKVLWPQLAHPGRARVQHYWRWCSATPGSTSAASARPPPSTPRSPCSRSCRWWLRGGRPVLRRAAGAAPRVRLPATVDLSTAVLLAAFAFVGFDGTTVLAGEVRDPRRSVPFAIVVSVACVIVLYTLIQTVCVGALPNLAASERPLADAAALHGGARGARS